MKIIYSFSYSTKSSIGLLCLNPPPLYIGSERLPPSHFLEAFWSFAFQISHKDSLQCSEVIYSHDMASPLQSSVYVLLYCWLAEMTIYLMVPPYPRLHIWDYIYDPPQEFPFNTFRRFSALCIKIQVSLS